MKRIGDALLRLQLDEQVEDRRLHRDVERRGRLVADDELRVAGERARDRDALLQAARELHRLLRQRPLGQPNAARRARAMPLLGGRPLRGRASFFSERSRIRRTEWRRFSAESGFWNTICSDAEVRRSSASGSAARSAVPSSVTAPLVGSTIPSSVRASVVLPLPDSPTRPSVSPGQIAALTLGERVDVVAVLAEHLAEAVEAHDSAAALRSTGGSSRSAASSRGSSVRAVVVPAAALVAAAEIVVERRLLACGSDRRRARSGRRTRSPEARRRGSAGSRGSCRAGPWSLRTPPRGMQRRSPTVYGCRGSVQHRARPALPRRAVPRRARRRGRTSSRSRRGCG